MRHVKINSIVILLVVLIVLSGGFFIFQYLKNQANNSANGRLFGDFDTAKISKIEITRGESGQNSDTILNLTDNKWLVTSQDSLPADQTIITNVLTVLSQARFKELVSANPAKQREYLVDDMGTRVKIYSGENALFDFYAGKNGPFVGTAYFRRAESDRVYLISENFNQLFNGTDWLDKKIVEINKNTIAKINWEYSYGHFSLEKINNEWQILGRPAKEEKIESLLDTLSSLSAQEVSWFNNDPPKKIDLTLAIEGNNGIKLFFSKDKENYAVNKEGDGRKFTINNYVFEQIAKKAVDF